MTNPAPSIEPAASDPVAAGRDALARHNWQKAFDLLSGADRDGNLSGADLEALAEASFFAGHSDREIEIKERAFKAHLADQDEVRAAYVAMRLARDYWFTGKNSIASAWGRRGEKLLEGKPETYAHGYLALGKSELASSIGNIDEALELAEQAVEIASRAAQADLQAYALTNLGRLKIATGATSDGMALMEEASISAVNGELSPFAIGRHVLHDDRGLPRPDRLPAGHRVDRGDGAVLRAPVGRGLPRCLPNPPGRGRRPEWRLGSGRGRASQGGRRAQRLQRHAATCRRLLRDGGNPAAEG